MSDVIVTCNGCFDGLHPGHLFYLGFCRAQGNILIVGLNSDEHIRACKGREPIPLWERMAAIAELKVASQVLSFREPDPRAFLRRVKPDIHCIGEEYFGRAIEEETCRELGITIVWVPRIGKWSSTLLRGTHE